MADHREQVCMQVSAGAADLLTFLGEQLLILEQLVSTLLFPALVERVGQGLDQLILTDVSVCVCAAVGGMDCYTQTPLCLIILGRVNLSSALQKSQGCPKCLFFLNLGCFLP